MTEVVQVIVGPVSVDGGVLRLVELSDGSGRVEIWSPHRQRWEPGGADVDQILRAGNTSVAKLKEYKVPRKYWGLPGTPSEAKY